MAVWSEVKKSQVLISKRIDAERYKPDYLDNEANLELCTTALLKTYINDIAGGATPKGANYPSNGIPFIRVQNVRENFWELDDIVYIDENIHNGQLRRSQVKSDDVLLTITGMSYGNSAVAWEEILPANMNQHSVRISLNTGLLSGFLSTFFICKYGKLQSDSKITGDTRPALTYTEIDKFLIPQISVAQQLEVHKIVRESFQKQLLSQSLYTQAQELLEQELGLDKLEFEKPVGYETSFSEATAQNRIDAEYFQPQFIRMVNALISKAHSSGNNIYTISELLKSSPKYGTSTKLNYINKGVPFLRIADLNNLKFDKDNLKFISAKDASNEKSAKISENDILISRSGTLGLTVRIPKELDGAIFGSYFIKLQLNDKIDARYFEFYLNSVAGKLQVDQYNTGGVQTNLTIPAIKSFVVVKLNPQKRKILLELVEKSDRHLKQSQQLLEQAITRVEQLIEEAAGKKWLRRKKSLH